MKPGVVLRRLAIAVASNDHSYMPQLVSVAVGNSRLCLQEVREIRIPSNVTGYVALLENANITQSCKSYCSSPPSSCDARLLLYVFLWISLGYMLDVVYIPVNLTPLHAERCIAFLLTSFRDLEVHNISVNIGIS